MQFFNYLFKFTFFDLLDIVLVAFLIYQLYNLIRGTIAANIFIGLAVIFGLYYVVKALHMQLLTGILGKFVDVGIIALIIVFQQEVRRFLLLVGKNASLQRNKAWWQYFFGKAEAEKNNYVRIKPIIDACKNMKQTRTGALIVFAKYYDEQFYQNSCEVIDGKISKRLLESIFQKTSPLHDGAVVIAENKIGQLYFAAYGEDRPAGTIWLAAPRRHWRYRSERCYSHNHFGRDRRNFIRQTRQGKNEYQFCRTGEIAE